MQNKVIYSSLYCPGWKIPEFCIVSKHFWRNWNGSVSYYNGVIFYRLVKLFSPDKEIPYTDSAIFAKEWVVCLRCTEIMEAHCSERAEFGPGQYTITTDVLITLQWHATRVDISAATMGSRWRSQQWGQKKKGSIFGSVLLFPNSQWDWERGLT